MIGFTYPYIGFSDILQHFELYTQLGVFQHTLLIGGSLLIFILIIWVLPYGHICYNFYQDEKTKRNRKILIKQIAMQKDIDDEIERELNIGN